MSDVPTLTLSKAMVMDGHPALMGGMFDPDGRLVDFKLEPLLPDWVAGAALVRRRMAEGDSLTMVAQTTLRAGEKVAHRIAAQLRDMEAAYAPAAHMVYAALRRPVGEDGGHGIL